MKETISQVKAKASKKLSRRKVLFAGVAAVVVVGGLIVSQMCCPFGEKKAAAPRVDEGVIVATIGNDKVTLTEIERIKNATPQLKDMPMQAELYKLLVDAYVNNKVILNAAKESGVQNRPAVKKMLEDAQDQILFQAYLTEQLQARMTNEVLQGIYQEELKNYVPEEEIHARHILVDSEKEAKDLIVKLKAGADFETLANKYSKDKNPNYENGGDLGYFKKSMMIPEFGNAAFAIKEGQISQKPIKTPFGWHVVKVEDRRQAAAPTMAEMADVIKAKYTELMVPQIMQAERQKANVVILDPLGLNKAPVKMEAPVAPAADEVKADEVKADEAPAQEVKAEEKADPAEEPAKAEVKAEEK